MPTRRVSLRPKLVSIPESPSPAKLRYGFYFTVPKGGKKGWWKWFSAQGTERRRGLIG